MPATLTIQAGDNQAQVTATTTVAGQSPTSAVTIVDPHESVVFNASQTVSVVVVELPAVGVAAT